MLHNKIWESEQFGYLSPEARLLFIGTITFADDDGYLKGNPAFLRAQIFPYDEDMSIAEIKKWRQEVVDRNLFILYEVDKHEYIFHPNWEKYQTLRNDMYKPSEIPPYVDGAKLVQGRTDTVTKTVQKRHPNITKQNITEHKENILTFWNEKGIITHKKLSKDASKEIEKLFGYPNATVDNQKEVLNSVKDAITLYETILHGKKYFWSHTWNLYEFLKRGYKQFEGKKPEDYIKAGGFNSETVTDEI